MRFWISVEVVYLQRTHTRTDLMPSRRVLCTPYSHAPCHFMQSYTGMVYVCLAVTCHLPFWQNDRDLLRATAVTWGWNGYQNKSQHRKLTLEKKILPPLLQWFEPATFQSRVRRSNLQMTEWTNRLIDESRLDAQTGGMMDDWMDALWIACHLVLLSCLEVGWMDGCLWLSNPSVLPHV